VGKNWGVSTIRVAVFDIGGVLVDVDYRYLSRKLFDNEADAERFLTEVLGDDFHHRRDLGATWAELVPEWSARHPDQAVAIKAFCERFPEIWAGPVPGSVEVLDELRGAGVPVYGLTNWGRETFPMACDRFPFLDSFDGVLVSGEVGLAKPESAIFTRFCEMFGVVPREAVFVDDVAENVAAANEHGFEGVVFTTANDLRANLIDLGLPLAATR